ncbi:hypothetical protein Pen02_62050 [Plantactinospora endophytica]|uniref:Type VII secretion protein EccB n=2 Tax=Plantactinospora endophytica TaxID=673535 RepID=A0ABQ4E964_9ACTN|nr:hypothetical protein Pen02_62050 [Plantactinospora endophytica]
MTEQLTPVPDPYARVLARHRRMLRRRAVAAGLAVVAVLVVTGVVVAGTGHRGTPDGSVVATPKPTTPEGRAQVWVDRLVQSPPRGAVGGDSAYMTALHQKIRTEQEAGRFAQLTMPMRDVRVLFVDDVGPVRVAFVAFVMAEPDPDSGTANAGRWLVAEAGAAPEVLGNPEAVQAVSPRLQPHEQLTLYSEPRSSSGLYVVSIAPDGCDFATAPRSALTGPSPVWTREPTGSYLVRPPNTLRNEWWQITCDGVLRERVPGPRSALRGELTEAHLDQAIAGARGTPDDQHARSAIREADSSVRTHARELPTLFWGGRTTGTPGKEYDGAAAVAAAPILGGGWTGILTVEYDEPTPRGALGSPAVFFDTTVDLADPRSLLAIPLQPSDSTLLVVSPVGAKHVRAVQDGRELVRAQVSDGAALLVVPSTDKIVLEGLDASGSVIGTGEIASLPGTGNDDGYTKYGWEEE